MFAFKQLKMVNIYYWSPCNIVGRYSLSFSKLSLHLNCFCCLDSLPFLKDLLLNLLPTVGLYFVKLVIQFLL